MEQKKRRMLTVGKVIDKIAAMRMDRDKRREDFIEVARVKFDVAELSREAKLLFALDEAGRESVNKVFGSDMQGRR